VSLLQRSSGHRLYIRRGDIRCDSKKQVNFYQRIEGFRDGIEWGRMVLPANVSLLSVDSQNHARHSVHILPNNIHTMHAQSQHVPRPDAR
jgi:hypothetical protein